VPLQRDLAGLTYEFDARFLHSPYVSAGPDEHP
jgi:hypothetical protein